jgi:hypothetical protein
VVIRTKTGHPYQFVAPRIEESEQIRKERTVLVQFLELGFRISVFHNRQYGFSTPEDFDLEPLNIELEKLDVADSELSGVISDSINRDRDDLCHGEVDSKDAIVEDVSIS